MPYDTGIADRLRKKGLRVKETSGWKSRGNSSDGSFYPEVFVRHHTAGAGPSAGVAPSLGLIINGRSDLAGPLANIYMDYDGVVYAIAAGAANHAGTPDGGSWHGATGNSSSYGFEIEHPGTYDMDDERAEIAAAACAALIDGRFGTKDVCDHKEWAPSRKIDLATSPSPSKFRDRVGYYLSHDYAPEPSVTRIPVAIMAALYEGEEDEMANPLYLIKDVTPSGDDVYYIVFASGLTRRVIDASSGGEMQYLRDTLNLKVITMDQAAGHDRLVRLDNALKDKELK